MLVIDRRVQEGFWVGEQIFVKVLGVGRERIKLGIAAPSDLRILRDELKDRPAPADPGDGGEGRRGEQGLSRGRAAEKALLESEAINRALLAAIPDMMFRMDRDGTYLDFLPAKGQEPLVPPGEFIGRKVHDVLPEELADQSLDYIKRALQSGETQAFEYELPIEGGLRNYEARIVVSGVDEVLAIVRDVTERKRAEQALEKAREELERKVERKLNGGGAYGLTFRELTVIHLVAEGKSDKEIGQELGISPRTANKHLQNILGKMDAGSRTEVGVRAIKEGLVG